MVAKAENGCDVCVRHQVHAGRQYGRLPMAQVGAGAHRQLYAPSSRPIADAVLDDLKVPPANRLEKLKGNLKNFYSIRINDQWRVIFRWVNGEAHDVRITDYH